MSVKEVVFALGDGSARFAMSHWIDKAHAWKWKLLVTAFITETLATPPAVMLKI